LWYSNACGLTQIKNKEEITVKKVFNRRIYHSLSAFTRDLGAIITRWRDMKELMRGDIIDAAFRERLMLAVTAVNGCRYCSWAHAKQALVTGITGDEVKALLTGEVGDSPAAELPALLYAQHWAESGGRPELAARTQLVETYGAEIVQAIELSLRTIQWGNLSGNTFDYILYRLSFGRLGGNDEPETNGNSSTEEQKQNDPTTRPRLP
jgi:AhpD family alkylhydroperoxidase